MMNPNRTKPLNFEAEQAVLGAILLDNAALEKVSPVLKAHHFYREGHRHIFRGMLTLAERNEPIELITLAHELRKKGRLEDVGGEAYIAALVDAVATSAGVLHHASMVKKEAWRRDLVWLAEEMKDHLELGREEPDEVAARTKAVLEEIEPGSIGLMGATIPLIEIADLAAGGGKEVDWAVEGLIVKGSVTALMGPPSGYKTWFAFCLA